MFLKSLDLQHPIIQASMAGTSTPAMAAAVSNVPRDSYGIDRLFYLRLVGLDGV